MPKDIIGRLNAVISRALNTPEMKDAFNKRMLEPQTSTPEQFAELIHTEIAQNARLISSLAGAKAK